MLPNPGALIPTLLSSAHLLGQTFEVILVCGGKADLMDLDSGLMELIVMPSV